MRTIATPLLALTLLLATATLATAGSERDKFQSLIGKYATSGLGMPSKIEAKTPCYCTPGSVPPAYAAGYLVHYPAGQYEFMNCWVPTFNPDGSLQGNQFCNSFAVIAK